MDETFPINLSQRFQKAVKNSGLLTFDQEEEEQDLSNGSPDVLRGEKAARQVLDHPICILSCLLQDTVVILKQLGESIQNAVKSIDADAMQTLIAPLHDRIALISDQNKLIVEQNTMLLLAQNREKILNPIVPSKNTLSVSEAPAQNHQPDATSLKINEFRERELMPDPSPIVPSMDNLSEAPDSIFERELKSETPMVKLQSFFNDNSHVRKKRMKGSSSKRVTRKGLYMDFKDPNSIKNSDESDEFI